MKKAKKNNKGFSLVELIVVVLIMAVIAVALAPQVMKWVNNARISTDRQTADSAVSFAQLAITDKDAYTAVTGATTSYTIEIKVPVTTGSTVPGYNIKKDGSAPANNDAFVTAFCEAAGIATSDANTDDNSGNEIGLKTTGATVLVTITKDGVVSWKEVDSSGNDVTTTTAKLTSDDLD